MITPVLLWGLNDIMHEISNIGLGKKCDPESTARPSRRKLARPHWTLRSRPVCSLRPINTPNDASNKSPYFEPCFLFSFHVVSLSEGIKAARLLLLPSIRQEFFEVNVCCFSFAFLFFFLFSLRKNLYNQRPDFVNFPNTSPFRCLCVSFLGFPFLCSIWWKP